MAVTRSGLKRDLALVSQTSVGKKLQKLGRSKVGRALQPAIRKVSKVVTRKNLGKAKAIGKKAIIGLGDAMGAGKLGRIAGSRKNPDKASVGLAVRAGSRARAQRKTLGLTKGSSMAGAVGASRTAGAARKAASAKASTKAMTSKAAKDAAQKKAIAGIKSAGQARRAAMRTAHAGKMAALDKSFAKNRPAANTGGAAPAAERGVFKGGKKVANNRVPSVPKSAVSPKKYNTAGSARRNSANAALIKGDTAKYRGSVTSRKQTVPALNNAIAAGKVSPKFDKPGPQAKMSHTAAKGVLKNPDSQMDRFAKNRRQTIGVKKGAYRG